MPPEKLVVEPVLLNIKELPLKRCWLENSCYHIYIYLFQYIQINNTLVHRQSFSWTKITDENSRSLKRCFWMLRPGFAQYTTKFNAPLGNVFFGEEEFRWSNNQVMEYTCLGVVKTNFIFTRRGSHCPLEFPRRDCCKMIVRYYTVICKLKENAYLGEVITYWTKYKIKFSSASNHL